MAGHKNAPRLRHLERQVVIVDVILSRAALLNADSWVIARVFVAEGPYIRAVKIHGYISVGVSRLEWHVTNLLTVEVKRQRSGRRYGRQATGICGGCQGPTRVGRIDDDGTLRSKLVVVLNVIEMRVGVHHETYWRV